MTSLSTEPERIVAVLRSLPTPLQQRALNPRDKKSERFKIHLGYASMCSTSKEKRCGHLGLEWYANPAPMTAGLIQGRGSFKLVWDTVYQFYSYEPNGYTL